MKRSWRLIYITTLTGTAAGVGLIITALPTDRATLGVAGLSLFFISLMGFRMAYERDALRRKADAVHAQELLLEAERGVFERDAERARDALEAHEHVVRAALDAERVEMQHQLDEERDAMHTEFANLKATWQRAAFAAGFRTCERGLEPDTKPADVIVLPVGANAPTVAGTGTTHS